MGANEIPLLAKIRENIIGQYAPIQTPFGLRPLVYADYTASGRSLASIEAQLQSMVLPWYANTHSEASFTGAQTTALREQARQAIRESLNATSDDKVIFCGSGATAAINRLIAMLNLRLPGDLSARYELDACIPEAERPVVFVGPYEHHSNELPWRESIADVVAIPLNDQGAIDCDALSSALVQYSDRPLRIGAFSAASNVTGILSDVLGITRQLKRAGALAFWDYAAAGPYVGIDMNFPGAAIDAIFLSPHKFIGGPGTPGILAVKQSILGNRVPGVVGGGTVSFVTPTGHRYLDDIERREEGGTPAIVETIRAGLVFKLQQAVGTDRIEALERQKIARVLKRLGRVAGLEILGGTTLARLSIVSLRISSGSRHLHYGFVVALLNDLFGIQARGGCSCAGPYGHTLLGLDWATSQKLENAVAAGKTALRPGWVRLNFNYFIDDEELEYLLGALELIAAYGERLLPAYQLDQRRGLWRHRESAGRLSVSLDELEPLAHPLTAAAVQRPDFSALLDEAECILRAGSSGRHVEALAEDAVWPQELEKLRWFSLGNEVSEATVPKESRG